MSIVEDEQTIRGLMVAALEVVLLSQSHTAYSSNENRYASSLNISRAMITR